MHNSPQYYKARMGHEQRAPSESRDNFGGMDAVAPGATKAAAARAAARKFRCARKGAPCKKGMSEDEGGEGEEITWAFFALCTLYTNRRQM